MSFAKRRRALAPAMAAIAATAVAVAALTAGGGKVMAVPDEAMEPARVPIASLPPPASLEGAPIALMEDLGSGAVLFSRDVDRRFLPASLTKLMTVYTAFELIAVDQLQSDQLLAVSDKAFDEWSGKGSSMFIAANSEIPVDTLLAGILTVSANDGCVVLAEGIAGSIANFTALMNAEARQLGMNDSHFHSVNGWPDEGRTYTTAHDLALLARALITRHPELYRRYFGLPNFTWNGITQNNRNPILNVVDGADGLKTGYTNEAGYGFVGSAERDGRRLIMVVAGTDSSGERRTIAREFINWGFDGWDHQRLYRAGELVARAEVQGGATRQVPLHTPRSYFAVSPAGSPAWGDGRPHVMLRYRGPVEAPIRKGEAIAELRVAVPGQEARALPLVAAADVPAAGPVERLRNGVLGLFD